MSVFTELYIVYIEQGHKITAGEQKLCLLRKLVGGHYISSPLASLVMRVKAQQGMHMFERTSFLVNASLSQPGVDICLFSTVHFKIFLKLIASEDVNPHWLHLWNRGMQVFKETSFLVNAPLSQLPHLLSTLAFFLWSHLKYGCCWKSSSFQKSERKVNYSASLHVSRLSTIFRYGSNESITWQVFKSIG